MWDYILVGSSLAVATYLYFSTRIDISDILSKADVRMVTDNKNIRPHDIIIHNSQAYDDFMSGNIGFMESYMKGYWSCNDL